MEDGRVNVVQWFPLERMEDGARPPGQAREYRQASTAMN